MTCATQACHSDPLARQCIICPAVPAVPAVTGHLSATARLGWDAGANSVSELDGDLHTVFAVTPGAGGAVLGLRSGREFVTVPDRIEHGLYFTAVAGIDVVSVIERGIVLTEGVPRGAGDTFEVRRVGGRVFYYQRAGGAGPAVRLFRSTMPSVGAKIVGACLFATGDGVP